MKSSISERNIKMKLAFIEDLPKIVDTYNLTIPGRMVTADTEFLTVASKLSWFESHQAKNRPLLIIYCDDNYCGWMSFSSFYGRPAYDVTAEISIYLDPDFQGKGIGNICLSEADNIASSCGIKNLLGFIFKQNEPSLKLFYRHGYEKWGDLPEVAEIGNDKRDLIILGKKIKV